MSSEVCGFQRKKIAVGSRVEASASSATNARRVRRITRPPTMPDIINRVQRVPEAFRRGVRESRKHESRINHFQSKCDESEVFYKKTSTKANSIDTYNAPWAIKCVLCRESQPLTENTSTEHVSLHIATNTNTNTRLKVRKLSTSSVGMEFQRRATFLHLHSKSQVLGSSKKRCVNEPRPLQQKNATYDDQRRETAASPDLSTVFCVHSAVQVQNSLIGIGTVVVARLGR